MAEIEFKHLGVATVVIPGDVEDDGLVDVLEHLCPLTDLACAQAVWAEPETQLDITRGPSLSRWNLENIWIQSKETLSLYRVTLVARGILI